MTDITIAIEGCCHGELDTIYNSINNLEAKMGVKVDLLLICGDFQGIRNQVDLACMAVPEKHKVMGDFYKYYSGQQKAPVLTLIIHGNHEASNFCQELPFGGWIAENIYYLGYAGVVNFGGLRIAGISGIYNEHHYELGHFEIPPYSEASKRSVYHTREIEVFKLLQLNTSPDIFLSHDWPRGIARYGNLQELLRVKPFFEQEIRKNTLGSPRLEKLLFALQPKYWFAAHLHVKFPAIMRFPTGNSTKFLSLDKCLPNRDCLQFITITVPTTTPTTSITTNTKTSPTISTFATNSSTETTSITPSTISPSIPNLELVTNSPTITTTAKSSSTTNLITKSTISTTEKKLCYDKEWLAILRSTRHFDSNSRTPVQLPTFNTTGIRYDYHPTEAELEEISEIFSDCGFEIPNNFSHTGPIHDPTGHTPLNRIFAIVNPQTVEFKKKLGLSVFHENSNRLSDRENSTVKNSSYVNISSSNIASPNTTSGPSKSDKPSLRDILSQIKPKDEQEQKQSGANPDEIELDS